MVSGLREDQEILLSILMDFTVALEKAGEGLGFSLASPHSREIMTLVQCLDKKLSKLRAALEKANS